MRDKIPQTIEKTDKIAVVETVDNEAYKRLLDEKLGEELREYLSSNSVEESADIDEVVYAMLKYKELIEIHLNLSE